MQTTYNEYQPIAYAGMLYDVGNRDIVSATDPTEVVPFGAALVQGPTDTSCRLPNASADGAMLLGIAIAEATKEQSLTPGVVNNVNYPAGTVNYPPGTTISILRQGRVWVAVEEAVTPGSPVFLRYAASGSNTQAGTFRASADGSTAVQLTDGAVWRTSAQPGGFAVLELNLPR